jgi:hypothetical protein
MRPGHRGVRADGTKELVAIADGHRESTESWATYCVICAAGVCELRWWRSVTGRWGSGPLTGRVPRRP